MEIDKAISNFRNNVITKSYSMSLTDWIDYCYSIVCELEKKVSNLNNRLKGELAEVVIEVILLKVQEILTRRDIPCIVAKNIGIIKESELNDKKYSTEIDVLLATPYMIYLFEVKSYTGTNKKTTGKCILDKGSGKTMNVYEQSKYHMDMFDKKFASCKYKFLTEKGIQPAYRLMFFEFSKDIAKDERNDKNKELVPYLNRNNVFNVLASEICDEKYERYKIRWDLNKMKKILHRLDANREIIMDYHINRLKKERDVK